MLDGGVVGLGLRVGYRQGMASGREEREDCLQLHCHKIK